MPFIHVLHNMVTKLLESWGNWICQVYITVCKSLRGQQLDNPLLYVQTETTLQDANGTISRETCRKWSVTVCVTQHNGMSLKKVCLRINISLASGTAGSSYDKDLWVDSYPSCHGPLETPECTVFPHRNFSLMGDTMCRLVHVEHKSNLQPRAKKAHTKVQLKILCGATRS